MHTLTEAQYKIEAEAIFEQVFNLNNECFDELILFTEQIPARKVIYIEDLELESTLVDALVSSINQLDDPGCYINLIDKLTKQPNYCYISISEFQKAYLEGGLQHHLGINFWSDYVVHSSQGKWGIVVTSAKFGLLGGCSEFIEKICEICPSLDRQVYDFLEYWKINEIDYAHSQGYETISNRTWITYLLTHVYGNEVAQRMLYETDLL
jgi:hypothetical protein